MAHVPDLLADTCSEESALDISRIRAMFPTINLDRPKKSDTHADRDPQGGHASHYDRERELSHEEVEEAKQCLEASPAFKKNSLYIEVRNQEKRYFLDVFDSRGRKIKSIFPLGIMEILREKKQGRNESNPVRILDRRL